MKAAGCAEDAAVLVADGVAEDISGWGVQKSLGNATIRVKFLPAHCSDHKVNVELNLWRQVEAVNLLTVVGVVQVVGKIDHVMSAPTAQAHQLMTPPPLPLLAVATHGGAGNHAASNDAKVKKALKM